MWLCELHYVLIPLHQNLVHIPQLLTTVRLAGQHQSHLNKSLLSCMLALDQPVHTLHRRPRGNSPLSLTLVPPLCGAPSTPRLPTGPPIGVPKSCTSALCVWASIPHCFSPNHHTQAYFHPSQGSPRDPPSCLGRETSMSSHSRDKSLQQRTSGLPVDGLRLTHTIKGKLKVSWL